MENVEESNPRNAESEDEHEIGAEWEANGSKDWRDECDGYDRCYDCDDYSD